MTEEKQVYGVFDIPPEEVDLLMWANVIFTTLFTSMAIWSNYTFLVDTSDVLMCAHMWLFSIGSGLALGAFAAFIVMTIHRLFKS